MAVDPKKAVAKLSHHGNTILDNHGKPHWRDRISAPVRLLRFTPDVRQCHILAMARGANDLARDAVNNAQLETQCSARPPQGTHLVPISAVGKPALRDRVVDHRFYPPRPNQRILLATAAQHPNRAVRCRIWRALGIGIRLGEANNVAEAFECHLSGSQGQGEELQRRLSDRSRAELRGADGDQHVAETASRSRRYGNINGIVKSTLPILVQSSVDGMYSTHDGQASVTDGT